MSSAFADVLVFRSIQSSDTEANMVQQQSCNEGIATVTVLDRNSSNVTTSGGTFLRERWTEFDARFSRCYRLLHFVACRILGSDEGVGDAIEKCRVRASRSSLEFEHEGAFRSWLVRVLIDEALSVLRNNRAAILNTD